MRFPEETVLTSNGECKFWRQETFPINGLSSALFQLGEITRCIAVCCMLDAWLKFPCTCSILDFPHFETLGTLDISCLREWVSQLHLPNVKFQFTLGKIKKKVFFFGSLYLRLGERYPYRMLILPQSKLSKSLRNMFYARLVRPARILSQSK